MNYRNGFLPSFSLMFVLLFLFVVGSVEASELNFTILHTNDEHSSLAPRGPAIDYHPEKEDSTRGGIVRLATAAEEIRKEKDEPVVLFSGGDFLGGAPYAWLLLADRAPELKIMQKMGYDAAVIGNHEFDYEPEGLARYLQNAGYPGASDKTALLGSNIHPPEDHALTELGIEKTRVLKLNNGLRIGLFGLIGKDAVEVTTSTGEVEFSEQHETAREMVDKLKGRNVDLIIAITHSGVEEDKDLAADIPEIDIIVGGHCHTALYEPEYEGDTIIVQAGSLLSYLGVLEIAYNPETGGVRVRNEETGHPHLLEIDDSLKPHPEVEEMMDDYTRALNNQVEGMTGGEISDIFAPLVYSEFELPNRPRLQETPFANYLVDAMRLEAEKAAGERVDVAIQANGQIRGGIIPGKMEHSRGQVSFYDLAKLSSLGMGKDGKPGYPLVSIYLTGEELRRVVEVSAFLSQYMGDTYFLQFSGLRFTYNPGRAILFTVPVLDIPIPTVRSAISVELYTGEGIQTEKSGDYVPLEKDDEELYHLVTDMYLLSFLPLVGELLPQLELVPKDAEGKPLEDFQEAVIKTGEGTELKTWMALARYAGSHPGDEQGLSRIPSYYEDTRNRIVEVWRPPFWIYIPLSLVLAIFIVVKIYRRPKKKKEYSS